MFLVHPNARTAHSPHSPMLEGSGGNEQNSYVMSSSGHPQEKRPFQQGWAETDVAMHSSKRSKAVKFAAGEPQDGAAAPHLLLSSSSSSAAAPARGKRCLSQAGVDNDDLFLAERFSLRGRSDYDDHGSGGDGDDKSTSKRSRLELADVFSGSGAGEGEGDWVSPSAGRGDGDSNYHAMNRLLLGLHHSQLSRRRPEGSSLSQQRAQADSQGPQELDMDFASSAASTPLSVLLRDLPSTRHHEYQYRCRLERESLKRHGQSVGEDCGGGEEGMATDAGSPASCWRPMQGFVMSLRSQRESNDHMSD